MAALDWRRVHTMEEDNLNFAIDFTEGALAFAVDQDVQATVKSNLAFYYAEAGRADMKELALRYAAESRAFYGSKPKYSGTKWEFLLANDVSTRLRYAEPCNLAAIQPIVTEIQQLMKGHPALQKEMRRYLEEARTKCQDAVK